MSDLFWSKVNITASDAECWEWNASLHRHGYGRVKFNGSVQNASRVAWELANSRSALDKVIRHTCDNPPCCNPAHLIVGTQKDNMRDMAARGRSQKGRKQVGENPNAKINHRDAAEIKLRIGAGENNLQIARDYPVTDSLISRIRTGRSWA